jgi:nicotinamide riboside kinase
MDERPFKVAFIGTHGVGKTTLCFGLAARLKTLDISLEVVHEVARRCPLPINEGTTVAAQSWILHTQIAEELVAGARYPLLICDRSVLDNYVYLLLAAGPQPSLETIIDGWLTTYDLLINVPLPSSAGIPFDGVRAKDPSFQRAVELRLHHELTRRRTPYLALDRDERSGWLERAEVEVRKRLAPPQMTLL